MAWIVGLASPEEIAAIKATNEKVAVICAVSFQEGKYAFTPFAAFFNGNPFEMLTLPMEVPSR